MESSSPNNPYAALKFRDYRYLLVGRFCSAFGSQMLTFAIAWDLWVRTRSPWALSLVGLVQVLPIIALALPAGVVADRKNRRHIVMFAQIVSTLCALSLVSLSYLNGPIWLIYIVLAVIGTARSFNDPAASTLLPLVVPAEHFTNAATWNSSVFQVAAIAGPTLAGVLIGLLKQVTPIYALATVFALANFVSVSLIRSRHVIVPPKGASLTYLKDGLKFITGHKIIMPAITLDLFAVLFGGAVALLPIYATDVLHVGSWGLGIMRAATSIGALCMAVFLAHRPPFRRAGLSLLLCVIGFGIATIIFGLSVWFPLSLAMLFLLGGLDNVSVVIRQTLMLTQVPDDMRGRTSAVNTIFISSSNELGDFESGVVAGLIGPVAAVVVGGIGTLLVVAGVWRIWPQLGRLTTLDQKAE